MVFIFIVMHSQITNLSLCVFSTHSINSVFINIKKEKWNKHQNGGRKLPTKHGRHLWWNLDHVEKCLHLFYYILYYFFCLKIYLFFKSRFKSHKWNIKIQFNAKMPHNHRKMFIISHLGFIKWCPARAKKKEKKKRKWSNPFGNGMNGSCIFCIIHQNIRVKWSISVFIYTQKVISLRVLHS